MLTPIEKFPERRAPVAVLRLFFRAQLCKCFLDLREIKQRIVTEAVCAARSVEDYSLGRAAKRSQSLAVAGRGQHANKSSGAFARRNALQFPQNARVVGMVIGVRVRLVRLFVLQ